MRAIIPHASRNKLELSEQMLSYSGATGQHKRGDYLP
jgi:hypothetical protein